MCEHTSPRHIVEEFTDGIAKELWMCCACGEIVGEFQKQNTNNCDYIPNEHHWISPKGKIISEYI